MGSLAHLFHQVCGCLCISELGDACLHGHCNGGSHLNGIQTVIIIKAVQLGNGIQVVNTAISAVGPDGLVFRLLGDVMAILIHIDAGALDNAASVTPMCSTATARCLCFCLGLATDLFAPVKTAPHEIMRGV